jgi:hypothetical protein
VAGGRRQGKEGKECRARKVACPAHNLKVR